MQITKLTELLKTMPKEELSPYEEIMNLNIPFGDPEIISQTTACLGMAFGTNIDVFDYNS